jgi:hypothetical protein
MPTWHAEVTWRTDTPPTTAAAEELVAQLPGHAPAPTIDTANNRIILRFVVEAPTLRAAADEAQRLARKAAGEASTGFDAQAVTVVDHDLYDELAARPAIPKLVGNHEFMQITGISSTQQLMAAWKGIEAKGNVRGRAPDPDFPAPVAEHEKNRGVWIEAHAVAYAGRRSKRPGPRPHRSSTKEA